MSRRLKMSNVREDDFMANRTRLIAYDGEREVSVTIPDDQLGDPDRVNAALAELDARWRNA